MSAQPTSETETVLVIGSTGNIGVAAIHAALKSGRNVLAIVRNQNSINKLKENITEGFDRITTVEASVVSETGVQSVVDRVRAGELPAFQHVHASVGGGYSDETLLSTSINYLRSEMTASFEANLFAYRATIPYLLEQKDHRCTWTMCTGAQGDIGRKALPALTQGALFSMANVASRDLADTNVRFNEIYLAFRVEYDADAEKHGVMKASHFARLYQEVLKRTDLKGCRVGVTKYEDVENLRYEKKIGGPHELVVSEFQF